MARDRGSRKPVASVPRRRSTRRSSGGEPAEVVLLRRGGACGGAADAAEDEELQALRSGCDEIRQRIAELTEVIAALEASRSASPRRRG